MPAARQPAFSYRHTSVLMAAPAQSLRWHSDTDWNAVYRHRMRCYWTVPPSHGLTLLTDIRWTKGACYTRRVQPFNVSGPKWPSKNYLGPHTWSRGLWPIHIYIYLLRSIETWHYLQYLCWRNHVVELQKQIMKKKSNKIWSSLSCIVQASLTGHPWSSCASTGGWAGRCEDLLFPAYVHGLEWEDSKRFAWNEKGPDILNHCFPSLMTSSVLRSPDQDPCCSFVGVSHQDDSGTS